MRWLHEPPRRSVWLLLIVAGGMLIYYIFGVRGRPERLFELKPFSLAGVRNGQAFVVERAENNGSFVVYKLPVTGGKKQEVGRDSTTGLNVSFPMVGDAGIFYTVSHQPPPQIPGVIWAPVVPAALRWIRPSGGQPRDLPVPLKVIGHGTGIEKVAIVGRTIYWIDVRPDEPNTSPVPAGRRLAPFQRSDLIATSLDDGSSRKLATGLSEYANLYPGKDGVYWTRTFIEPIASGICVDLTYFGATAAKKPIVHHYDGNSPPKEFNGRIYWLQEIVDHTPRRSSPSVAPASRGKQLVCAKQDGTDLRVLLRLENSGYGVPDLRELNLYDGRLYVLLAEPVRGTGNSRGYTLTLCKVDPAKQPVLDRLLVLPLDREYPNREGAGLFDGVFYYFVVNEARENWLDWSPRGLRAKHATVLYRYHLPE